MWPGLVGKGGPGAEPAIDLDTMLNLTAAARVNGTRFDGVDLFLFDPHVSIDASDDDLKRLADKIGSKGLVVGSLVAPVWPPTGGGSAMGNGRRALRVPDAGPQGVRDRQEAQGPRHPALRHRPNRFRRRARRTGRPILPATRRRLPRRFGRPRTSRRIYGERLAAEGEICWGGMHSVKRNVELLEAVDRPGVVGFQADMAHTLLFTMGYNAPGRSDPARALRLVRSRGRSMPACRR